MFECGVFLIWSFGENTNNTYLLTHYPRKYTGTTSLEHINIAYNKLNGSVPILQHLENLTKVILRDNEFDSVQAKSFSSNSTSLKIVDLSYQRPDGFTLLDRAFASLPSGINIILTGNTISTIPPQTFDGLNNASLDLTDLSIHTIAPLAFSGTSNLTIDLRGNYITTVDPTSFPRGVVRSVRAYHRSMA